MKKYLLIVIMFSFISISNHAQIYSTGYGGGFARNCIEWSNTIPLPLGLIAFNASCLNNKAVLTWSAAGSGNNYFSVEKSADGIHFHTVGSIPVKENADETNQYSYTEESVLPGKSFYRIKRTGSNGQFVYSETVSSFCKRTGAETITVYPNPASDLVSIVVNKAAFPQNSYSLVVKNHFGQPVYISKVNSATNVISLGHLPQGIYFIEVQTPDNSVYHKIVITGN